MKKNELSEVIDKLTKEVATIKNLDSTLVLEALKEENERIVKTDPSVAHCFIGSEQIRWISFQNFEKMAGNGLHLQSIWRM